MGISVKRKAFLGVAFTVCMVAGVAIANQMKEKENVWRYRMTVEIDTPEGVKSGSVVREVIYFTGTPKPSPYAPRIQVKGEAIPIDLGKRGVVFAIMSGGAIPDYGYYIVFKAFPSPKPPLTPEGLQYYNQLKDGKATIESKFYPTFVAFKDLKNPKSVELVYQIKKHEKAENHWTNPQYFAADNFERFSGKGVHIKSVSIEMTQDKVTWGIEKWLPWILENKGGYLDGQLTGGGPALANILHGGYFRINLTN